MHKQKTHEWGCIKVKDHCSSLYKLALDCLLQFVFDLHLPSSFSWQNLKDRFRDIGEVRFAEIKSQGNAIVRFTNVQDAQRAVDLMNGYRMEGRAIQVRFY